MSELIINDEDLVAEGHWPVEQVARCDWAAELVGHVGDCAVHVLCEIRRPIDVVQAAIYHPMRPTTCAAPLSIVVHSERGVASEVASISSSSSALCGKTRA